MSMPLYSTDDLSNFGKNDQAGPVYEAVPGKEVFPELDKSSVLYSGIDILSEYV